MNAAPAAVELNGMLKMKHLVIDEVLDGVAGNLRAIEDATHYDGVVRRIVMSEALTRCMTAPRHQRTSQQSVEEASIQFFKNLFKVISSTCGRQQHLASPLLSQQMSFAGDIPSPDVLSITGRVPAFDLLAVQLRQQNVRDGVQHVARRARQQVGNAHEDFALAQPDSVVDVREWEKLDAKLGEGSPRANLAIRLRKNLVDPGGHLTLNLA